MIKFLKDQTWEFWFEWISTGILIAGVILTSLNIYPLNLWVSFIGNFGWLVLGYIWRKWSLVVVEVIIVAIYFGGIYNIV